MWLRSSNVLVDMRTDMQENLEANLRDIACRRRKRVATRELRGSAQTPPTFPAYLYRDEINSLQIQLSRTKAGPGRAVKQEQEEKSRNYVQAF